MTERLYYEDAYLTKFTAQVIECREERGAYRVRLDRSAFYPTSGGQPHDTGRLGGLPVINVQADEAGEVWHSVNTPLSPGLLVDGLIDWPRRFDHMQQHAGEHMLAGALFRVHGGRTIGLHLGAEVSTIDVELPGGTMRLDKASLDALEDQVNADIQRDEPIRCWFPDRQELHALPLRKPPTVDQHVRIVAIGDKEMVACGGTHPKRTGEIGAFKIIDARPSKGKMRVTFLAGRRAMMDYRRRFDLSEAAAGRMSAQVDQLDEAVAQKLQRIHELENEIRSIKRAQALKLADSLWRQALSLENGWRIVCAHLSDIERDELRDIAGALCEHPEAALLLAGGPEPDCALLFARGASVDLNMGEILKEAALAHGGRGGGKPAFAQGGARDAAALDGAMEKVLAYARK